MAIEKFRVRHHWFLTGADEVDCSDGLEAVLRGATFVLDWSEGGESEGCGQVVLHRVAPEVYRGEIKRTGKETPIGTAEARLYRSAGCALLWGSWDQDGKWYWCAELVPEKSTGRPRARREPKRR